MAEHTQLPWKTQTTKVQTLDGSDIATCWDLGRDKGVSEANAAFIVMACNSHEKLVRTLEVLRVRLFHEQGGQPDSPWATPIKVIDEALVLATGETP